MLKGREISEIKFSELNAEHRIDAEYFSKENIRLNQIIQSYNHEKIIDFAKVTDGEHGSPDLDETSGILYLSGHNVKDNVLELSNIRHCSKKLHKKNARSALTRDTVLLSIVGTIGNASVVYEDIVGNTDRNVATIKKISADINPYYLATFLNSKFGKYQTNTFSTGNNQPLLNLSQVKSIIVCLPSKDFQKEVEKIVKAAHAKLAEAKSLYAQAEDVLLLKLGLQNWQPQKETVVAKKFSNCASNGRLDAEFYQNKYVELERKIKLGSCKPIAELKQFNARGIQPVYDSDGTISVINSKHILETSLDYYNFEKTNRNFYEKKKNAKIKQNDILIYTTGANIGRTQPYLISDDALASNHVNILRLEGINPLYAAVVLNSKIGRMQTTKFCTGSAQVEIYPSEIEKFLIPILPNEIQEEIAKLVKKSFDLRMKSRAMLNKAKEMVEKEIEG